jgi:hypothetical protein
MLLLSIDESNGAVPLKASSSAPCRGHDVMSAPGVRRVPPIRRGDVGAMT